MTKYLLGVRLSTANGRPCVFTATVHFCTVAFLFIRTIALSGMRSALCEQSSRSARQREDRCRLVMCASTTEQS